MKSDSLRYKSILCEEDVYLLELVRYIHLNPLRAGIVEDLNTLLSYPNCGHSVLMGKLQRPWQDVNYILRFFGTTPGRARRSYLDFVSGGVTMGHRRDLTGGGLIRSHGGWAAVKAMRSSGWRIVSDERILGSSDFVEGVLIKANEDYERKRLAKAMGANFDDLLMAVANRFGINQALLKGPTRKRDVARARSIICSLAVERLMIRGVDVARELALSPSAVSKLASRGRQDRIFEEMAEVLFVS